MPVALPADTSAIDRSLLWAAQQTRDVLVQRTGVSLKIKRGTAPDDNQSPSIVCRYNSSAAIAPREDTAHDGYHLTVTPKGVIIEAPGPAGLRHGLQTLTQIVTRDRIPCCRIADQPDFRDRGLMLDVSRGKVPRRATLERLVDLCSQLRLNVLMLYVEHTFDFQKHPEIGAGSSPLSAETILALDVYAKDRGVELIPCLQSLGHMEHILSLDRYAPLAESERRWSLSPALPETYSLIRDLYAEFLPLFSSHRMNANCDEPFDLGMGRATKLAKQIGRGGVFARHVEKLRKIAKGHNKQLMIWADFALSNPEHIDEIDRKTVLLDWWYEADFDADRIRRLRRKGFEVWGCPGTSSWNCLFPRTQNAEGNVARWARAGRKHGAKGILNTDWGDFGHYNALGVSLQGYAFGAQQAWSGDTDRASFDRAFDREIFGEGSMRPPPIARLFRRLGAIHDAGFKIFNGSALQYLYFDPMGRSFFLSHVRKAATERSARQLRALLKEIDALEIDRRTTDFAGLALREIRWAARATLLSATKGLLALEFNAWRESPEDLGARERKRLAANLDAAAFNQAQQLVELESLWLARNHISDFRITKKRIQRSVRSLRTAANQLRQNRPPRPAAKKELTLTSVYNEVRKGTQGANLR